MIQIVIGIGINEVNGQDDERQLASEQFIVEAGNIEVAVDGVSIATVASELLNSVAQKATQALVDGEAA